MVGVELSVGSAAICLAACPDGEHCDRPEEVALGGRVGELGEGYEANFLVLNGNPLDDPANLHQIGMRVKQGLVLPPMPHFVLVR